MRAMKPNLKGKERKQASSVLAWGWLDRDTGLDAECIVKDRPGAPSLFNGEDGYIPVKITESFWDQTGLYVFGLDKKCTTSLKPSETMALDSTLIVCPEGETDQAFKKREKKSKEDGSWVLAHLIPSNDFPS